MFEPASGNKLLQVAKNRWQAKRSLE